MSRSPDIHKGDDWRLLPPVQAARSRTRPGQGEANAPAEATRKRQVDGNQDGIEDRRPRRQVRIPAASARHGIAERRPVRNRHPGRRASTHLCRRRKNNDVAIWPGDLLDPERHRRRRRREPWRCVWGIDAPAVRNELDEQHHTRVLLGCRVFEVWDDTADVLDSFTEEYDGYHDIEHVFVSQCDVTSELTTEADVLAWTAS